MESPFLQCLLRRDRSLALRVSNEPEFDSMPLGLLQIEHIHLCIENVFREAGGMAKELCGHAVFPEDMNLVLSTHTRQFPTACKSSSRGCSAQGLRSHISRHILIAE